MTITKMNNKNKGPPTEKCPRSNAITAEFYQSFKVLSWFFLNYFKQWKGSESLLTPAIGSHLLNSKIRKRHGKKKLKTNMPNEHRFENPKQNTK